MHIPEDESLCCAGSYRLDATKVMGSCHGTTGIVCYAEGHIKAVFRRTGEGCTKHAGSPRDKRYVAFARHLRVMQMYLLRYNVGMRVL